METYKNIVRAIAGESMARNKYTFFASQAKKEGLEQISAIFLETADNEKEHAKRLMKLLKNDTQSSLEKYDFPIVQKTLKNLKTAAAGEHYENTIMYPQFAQIAKKEGFKEIAKVFTEISEVEKRHEKRYLKLEYNLKNGLVFKRSKEVYWKCRNCGYIHFGKTAPKECPACAHPQSYYELFCENY
ncbi:MAG: rubrerythrin family protein [Patescibacteria group bacterium]|nr:rubrerythrin family protein [Patescibacteria group bacterium]